MLSTKTKATRKTILNKRKDSHWNARKSFTTDFINEFNENYSDIDLLGKRIHF